MSTWKPSSAVEAGLPAAQAAQSAQAAQAAGTARAADAAHPADTARTGDAARPALRLLLLNPNASARITRQMAAVARAELLPGEALHPVTNPQGPPAVRDAATLAQAEAGLPGLLAWQGPACDAALLAISLDRAAERLRGSWPGRPLIGLTEAAVASAALSAPRVGLLTLGAHLLPAYQARLDALLPAARHGGVAAAEAEWAFGEAAGDGGVDARVLAALVQAAASLKADAVVLAGAVLSGYDRALQAALGRPVFDGVRCGVRLLRALR